MGGGKRMAIMVRPLINHHYGILNQIVEATLIYNGVYPNILDDKVGCGFELKYNGDTVELEIEKDERHNVYEYLVTYFKGDSYSFTIRKMEVVEVIDGESIIRPHSEKFELEFESENEDLIEYFKFINTNDLTEFLKKVQLAIMDIGSAQHMEERKKRQEEAKKYEELKNKVSDLL